GLPGAAAIIESLPWGTPVELVSEVDAEDDRQPLPDNGGLRVHWRYRRGAAAGTTTALADTVRDLSFPAGTPYAWGGAESRVVTAVRRHLRDERGLPQSAVSMTGYWRRDAH
ncbi:MAG: siderophore-interacting protein, partial [Ilumatobacteraceae bacterium]